MVKIQGGIKQQEKASLSLMTPHWIISEHHYVALTHGHVDDRGRIR
jgi:hypothetical protein